MTFVMFTGTYHLGPEKYVFGKFWFNFFCIKLGPLKKVFATTFLTNFFYLLNKKVWGWGGSEKDNKCNFVALSYTVQFFSLKSYKYHY